jgi:hypothetical protein
MTKKHRTYEIDLPVMAELRLERPVDGGQNEDKDRPGRTKKHRPIQRDSVLRLIERVKKV